MPTRSDDSHLEHQRLAEAREECGICRGLVVKLKSGGPDMTVFDPDYHDNYSTWSYPRGVLCVWFVGDEVNRDVFPKDALKVVR